MAWLHASPKPVGNDKKERKPRIKTLDESAPEMELPDVGAGGYLVRAFIQSGMSMSNGMGASPITWQELSALREVIELDNWEALQIMQMSKSYCSMLHKAEERIPPPYSRELTEDEMQWLAKQQIEAFERIEAQSKDIKIKKPR